MEDFGAEYVANLFHYPEYTFRDFFSSKYFDNSTMESCHCTEVMLFHTNICTNMLIGSFSSRGIGVHRRTHKLNDFLPNCVNSMGD